MQRGTSREWGGMQGWSVGEPDVPNEFAFFLFGHDRRVRRVGSARSIFFSVFVVDDEARDRYYGWGSVSPRMLFNVTLVKSGVPR